MEVCFVCTRRYYDNLLDPNNGYSTDVPNILKTADRESISDKEACFYWATLENKYATRLVYATCGSTDIYLLLISHTKGNDDVCTRYGRLVPQQHRPYISSRIRIDRHNM